MALQRTLVSGTVLSMAILLPSLSALSASTADGTRFTWLKGKGVAVCEAYKKYVESFEDPMDQRGLRTWEEKPMCARTIPNRFSSFSQPSWREITPTEYGPMLMSVYDNMTYDV